MMKFMLTILLLFISSVYADTININETTKVRDILPLSEIYIDKTRNLTVSDLQTQKILFEKNDKSLLGYGYSPDFDVWIKITLKNDSEKTIRKIIEYGNSMTTDIIFYDVKNGIEIKEGLLNISTQRNSINPIFRVTLDPHQTKIYYIKASSYITTLIVKLNLFNDDTFYKKEIKHQVILALFFGAMIVLAVYNAFIYFFTKDLSYLFYVLYIFGITMHHLMYVGMANIYLLDKESLQLVVQYASFLVIFPAISLALFTKYFLNISQYKILNKILNFFLYIALFSVVLFTISDYFNHYRNLIPVVLLVYLCLITIYATLKKNRQAYFILFGWLIFVSMGTSMYLSSIGVFTVFSYFPYFVEISLIVEIIIFSIALSDKINSLQKEKNDVNEELIVQKKTENERLEIQVEEKTKDLNVSLDEKTLLLKEVNHRVKNNMQMIVSLIRLQSNDIDDKKMKNIFLTTQNRLNAMSQLHELLYQRDDISYINAYEYFTTLIEGLEETYTDDINIEYDIDADLQTEQAISCGIILNELVTNSLKYAFNEDDDGLILISLFKSESIYTLIIKDNGQGYDANSIKKSFGLILVETLVSSKLRGEMVFNTTNGVETKIIWSESNE